MHAAIKIKNSEKIEMKVPCKRPVIGDEEINAVVSVLRSGNLVQGKVTEQLEKMAAEVCGTRHAIATSSGTTALELALRAHGIGPGDEVITTAFTFMATVNAIIVVGAKPVFADVLESDFNMDPASVKRCITSKTKCLMPVHLFGQSADLLAIQAIADAHKLVLIEDACQSIGALYYGKPVGSFGTGVFSLHVSKNITSAEGGLITTNDDEIAAKCRLLRSHGMQERYKYECLGYNYRMTDVHAAIGVEQFKRMSRLQLDRCNVIQRLSSGLQAFISKESLGRIIQLPQELPHRTHVWSQYTVLLDPSIRDIVAKKMTDAGVDVRVFYAKPCHHFSHVVKAAETETFYLHATELMCMRVLSLPAHARMSDAEVDYVVQTMKNAVADACSLRFSQLPARTPSPQPPLVTAAIVGVGVMGARHLTILQKMKGVDIVAIVEPDLGLILKAKESLGKEQDGAAPDAKVQQIPEIFASYDAMITSFTGASKSPPNFAIIAVPTPFHKDITIKALSFGSHVLVEKPIASTVSEAHEMARAAVTNGKILAVGHVERYNPVVVALKQELDCGRWGDITNIRTCRSGPFPARMRKVGVLNDLAVHDIDIIRFVTGKEIIAVTGSVVEQDDCVMTATALATLSCGAPVVIHCSWLTKAKVREIEITCEKGVLHANYATQELFAVEAFCDKQPASAKRQIAVTKAEPLVLELETFVDAVRTGRMWDVVRARDATAALHVSSEIERSAKEMSIVTISGCTDRC